jgi:hypothetical protein
MLRPLLLLAACCFGLTNSRATKVDLLRTPDGGIQPQAAVDRSGTVHLIYYKGDPAGGDIFYVHRAANGKEFSAPIRVNTQTGSAIAVGNIRGAQLALGRNGRVHVAWDGMGKGATPAKFKGKEVTPLLYTRLNEGGTAFEAERNVITFAYGLDGGSSLAADPFGNVYVAWHGREAGSGEGEAGRELFVARSQDDGRTFAAEKPATSKQLGACACCGMRAFADDSGAVYILYRAATENTERGETLLISPKPGADFQVAFAHPWKAATCPMSSATLSVAKGGAVGAWETGKQVYFAKISPGTMQVAPPIAPRAAGSARKHPVAMCNAAGESLFAWIEGVSWGKGGSLVWELFDVNGNPTGDQGRTEGVPTWSLITAFSNPDGNFTIVY